MKTTRELAKEATHKVLVQNLQELLVKNYDANKGFKKAFNYAKDPNLRDYLKVQALMHHRFATQLDKLIHSLNETPINEGSTVGRFHRTWMDIMAGIYKSDDEKILDECRRGQRATFNEYKRKIKHEKFPAEIKNILKYHLLEMENMLTGVKIKQDVG